MASHGRVPALAPALVFALTLVKKPICTALQSLAATTSFQRFFSGPSIYGLMQTYCRLRLIAQFQILPLHNARRVQSIYSLCDELAIPTEHASKQIFWHGFVG